MQDSNGANNNGLMALLIGAAMIPLIGIVMGIAMLLKKETRGNGVLLLCVAVIAGFVWSTMITSQG